MDARFSYQQLQQVGRYVGFDEGDALLLQELAPIVNPRLRSIAYHFYATLLDHPEVRTLIVGESRLTHLRSTLLLWMSALFSGNYDEAYAGVQARIGETHVRMGVDERYMLAAINLVREQLHDTLEDAASGLEESPVVISHARRRAGQRALDRICDMSLSVILGAYRRRYLEDAAAEARMAQVGRIASAIGQELREPLSVIETSAAILDLGCDEFTTKRHLQRISSHVRAAGSAIDGLLQIAASKPVERQVVSLKGLIEDAVTSASLSADVDIQVVAPTADLLVHVDPTSMKRLIEHLLGHAAGSYSVAQSSAPRLVAAVDGDALSLIISDGSTGSHEAPAQFESADATHDELGLGLLLCRTIAEHHGGTLEVRRDASEHLAAIVRLPSVVRRAA